MSDWTIFAFIGLLAVCNGAVALYEFRYSAKVAEKNRQFIESGEEAFFEQRRAWTAYGTTPEVDPHRLRRKAGKTIAINAICIAIFVLFLVAY